MSFPYIMQGKNLVIVIDNQPHTVGEGHICYEKILEAIKAADWDQVRELVNPREVLMNFAQGNVKIQDDRFYWQDQEMHLAISDRMISMLKEGFDVTPLVNFMDKVMQNPSYRSVQELYGFLENNDLPITPDGDFLAYKKVRADYLDCHTGTILNSVGSQVKMQRNQVNDNAQETCSAGLHFCSLAYLQHFSGPRTMILKINPRDVVSIPSDYNNSKGRCCAYEVIAELGVRPEDAFKKTVDDVYTSRTPTEQDWQDLYNDDLDSTY